MLCHYSIDLLNVLMAQFSMQLFNAFSLFSIVFKYSTLTYVIHVALMNVTFFVLRNIMPGPSTPTV